MYANVFVSAPSGYAFVSKATGRCNDTSTERAWAQRIDVVAQITKEIGYTPGVEVAVHVEQPAKKNVREQKREKELDTDRGHRGEYSIRSDTHR